MEINIDNQGAMKLAENQSISNRSKHIDLKMFYIRENIDKGLIKLKYVSTEYNLADSFTKPINGQKLIEHLSAMGIRDPVGVLKVNCPINNNNESQSSVL